MFLDHRDELSCILQSKRLPWPFLQLLEFLSETLKDLNRTKIAMKLHEPSKLNRPILESTEAEDKKSDKYVSIRYCVRLGEKSSENTYRTRAMNRNLHSHPK